MVLPEITVITVTIITLIMSLVDKVIITNSKSIIWLEKNIVVAEGITF